LSSRGEAIEALCINRSKIQHSPRSFIVAGNIYWDACDKLASARSIMEKFVDKVDTGRARSKETYAEMKEWMDDER